MLTIHVLGDELFNERTNEFVYGVDKELKLEHSLVAISKWEMKYKKPFLHQKDPTEEELLYYFKCMTITQNVEDRVYNALSQQNVMDILNYMKDPATATTVRDDGSRSSGQILTSEYIYFLMFANHIPKECEKWNFNRLFMLLKVFGAENAPKKDIPMHEMIEERNRLNEERRRALKK